MKGESRSKWKRTFSIAECRGKFIRTMPRQEKVHENEVSRIDSAEPHPIFYKDSERRKQSQIYLNYAEPSPIFAHSANIVKGEGRGKGGNEFFTFGLYRSLLYSINIKCMV